jgi:hypothetical protein
MTSTRKAIDISKIVKEPTFADNLIKKFDDWLVTKGWIYIFVFIMGVLLGGLIWK